MAIDQVTWNAIVANPIGETSRLSLTHAFDPGERIDVFLIALGQSQDTFLRSINGVLDSFWAEHRGTRYTSVVDLLNAIRPNWTEESALARQGWSRHDMSPS